MNIFKSKLSLGLLKINEYLICVLLSIVVLSSFLGVVFRYVPGLKPLFWTGELSRYTNIMLIFLTGSINVRKDANFKVRYFMGKINNNSLKGFITLISDSLILCFLLLLLFYGLKLSIHNIVQRSSALGWPMFYIYLSIPIGSLLMIKEHIVLIITRRGKRL